MKKFLFVLALVVFFLISLLVTQARAFPEWSDYDQSDSYSPPGLSDWTNPENANDDDTDTYAVMPLPGGSGTKYEGYYNWPDLPTTGVPSYIEVYMKVKRSESNATIDVSASFFYDKDVSLTWANTLGYGCNSADYDLGVRLENNTNVQEVVIYVADNDGAGRHCVSDYFTAHGWDTDEMMVYALAGNNATADDLRVYDLQVRVVSDVSTSVSLVDSTASASAQFVTMDLEGYTAYAGEGVICELRMFEDCEREGFASIDSEIPVAYIELDPESTETQTIDIGGGYYQGYGYSEASSHWFADGIRAPYHDGFTCHYPIQTLCTERIYTCDGENCYWTDTEIHVDEWDEGEDREIVHEELYTEPEPDNPLSWIVWKLKKTFWEFFQYRVADSSEIIFEFKGDLEERAPFAYILPVFDLDLSDPATSSAIPDIEFSFYGVEDPYTFEASQDLIGFFNSIRTAAKVVVWLIFVLYLFLLTRRLL